jgi:hypothetical protein
MLFKPVDASGIQLELPGRGIIVSVGADRIGDAVVVQLADASGKVTSKAKRLRQALLRRNRLAEDLTVVQDAGAVRIEAGQHRVAARPAQRKRAVRMLEANAAPRELVDIRRPGQRIAITAREIVEVVRDYE